MTLEKDGKDQDRPFLASERAEDVVLTALPLPVRKLFEFLDDLADENFADLAEIQWHQVDNAASQILTTLTEFVFSTECLLPAKRGLKILSRIKDETDNGIGPLMEDLRQVDENLSADDRGFSRLLENAMESGDVEPMTAFTLSELPETWQSRLAPVQAAAHVLEALDELSHALAYPMDVGAAAVVADLLQILLVREGKCPPEVGSDVLSGWLTHRQAKPQVWALLQHRSDLDHLAAGPLKALEEKRLERLFAMWLLAWRKVHGSPFLSDDQAQLSALFERADLPPPEFFESAPW